MNSELISRLALEAGEYTNSVYTPPVRSKTPGIRWEPGHVAWHVIFQEKFAELIVQECANHCDLLLDHKISSEWSRGTHDCSRAIKQHFGVSE